jgi:hypothetical protein
VVPEGTAPASKRVYFQPPEASKLEYPCVIYKRDKMNSKYAGNVKYAKWKRYQVTTMDPDPDGLLHDAVFELPHCSHVRKFVVGGLNHDIFDLYY